MTLFMIIMAAARWSNPRYATYFFSYRARSFLKRLNQECAASTIPLLGLKPCCSMAFFSSPRGGICGVIPWDTTSCALPMHPASRQRFCLMDSTCPKSKGTTRFRRSPSSTALSCRLAPVATSDNGMSFASANRFFLFPFFFPNRRIGADGLLSKRRFVLRAVGRLPCPGNFRHFGISHRLAYQSF